MSGFCGLIAPPLAVGAAPGAKQQLPPCGPRTPLEAASQPRLVPPARIRGREGARLPGVHGLAVRGSACAGAAARPASTARVASPVIILIGSLRSREMRECPLAAFTRHVNNTDMMPFQIPACILVSLGFLRNTLKHKTAVSASGWAACSRLCQVTTTRCQRCVFAHAALAPAQYRYARISDEAVGRAIFKP